MKNSMNEIWPIGKYKGQHINTIPKDYIDWIISQPWFREKYPQYVQIIINNHEPPENTPEHNKLVARLLNKDIILKLTDKLLSHKDENYRIEFETKYGWDASIYTNKGTIAIEAKPTIGDDFPVILRTIKHRINRWAEAQLKGHRYNNNDIRYYTHMFYKNVKAVILYEQINASISIDDIKKMFDDILLLDVNKL